MIKTLLMWITARLPVKVISDHGVPFLERYYVGRIRGATVYIHRFVASDPDRGLHDHPWAWAFSLVLAGWYYEDTRAGRRKVLWLNRLTGDTFHRVVLPLSPERDHEAEAQLGVEPLHKLTGAPQECWTLFVHESRKSKAWGFLRPRFQSGGRDVQLYVEHRDGDDSDASDAWAKTAPKGRELRT